MRRLFLLSLLVPAAMHAADVEPATVSDMLEKWRVFHLHWLQVAETFGAVLFGTLATIELCVAFYALSFAAADLTVWTAEIMRRSFIVAVFYTFLTLMPSLASDVISMYTNLGQQASGITGGISASNLLADGLSITLSFILNAVRSAGTLSFLTALFLAGCAAVIMWCFIKLVKAFAMAKVESYITISAAMIQLAWGGSRFTSNFAERYIGGAIANGVRLMAIYLLVGVEHVLAPSWVDAASHVGTGPFTVGGGLAMLLGLTSSVVIFCAFADVEKWTASLFGGQPSFSGHDVTNAYMPFVNAGISAGVSAVSTGMTIASGGGLAPLAAAGMAGNASRYAGATLQIPHFAASNQARPFHMPPASTAPPMRLLPPGRP